MVNSEPFIMIYCTVWISTVVIWWISSEYLCLVIYDPQAIRRHPEHRSHGLLTRLCGHTQHTQWETDGRETHKKRVDFPISSPCWGPSPSSTFTQMHFHLSTTPENREKLKTLSFEKVTAVWGEGCMSYNARKKERNSRSEPHKQTHILIRGALSVHTYLSAEISGFSHTHTHTHTLSLHERRQDEFWNSICPFAHTLLLLQTCFRSKLIYQ